jgi:hypothetical protein
MKDVKQENKKGNQMATNKLTMQEKIKKVIDILESPCSHKSARERSLKILKTGIKVERINIKEAKEILDRAMSYGLNRYEVSIRAKITEMNLSRIFHGKVENISKKTIQPLIDFVETLEIGEKKSISHADYYKFKSNKGVK